jgi:bacillithiol biosynthesis cysteine-adding enzyme BshC
MSEQNIPLAISGQVSSLILDYVANKETIQPFYQYKNDAEGFKQKIESTQFSKEKRELLFKQLKQQYLTNGIALPKTLDLLLEENTYVVTTGHQLCLFGGPQYFIHKIVSTIKLAKQLKEIFPSKNFIPLFWLASEDHDFDEINHAHIYHTTLQSKTELKGAVGRLPMSIFKDSYLELYELLGDRAKEIKELFDIDFGNKSLAQVTSEWVQKLFKEEDLIILDGDDTELKRSFIPTIKKELIGENSFNTINTTSEQLKELGFKAQVTPREINLFYLKNNLRERIVLQNDTYTVLNTDLTFSKNEILDELEKHPDRFSPNVVFRPVYQEAILPNLAYIGGPGELAYWLQLKNNFENLQTSFPILVLRDLFLPTDEKTQINLKRLNLNIIDFFSHEDDIIKVYLKNNPSTHVDFDSQIKQIEVLKDQTLVKVTAVDKSLSDMVEAEYVKMKKRVKRINLKTQRSIKKREEVSINRIKNIKAKVTPNGKLAERRENFIPAYLNHPKNYIQNLINLSDPFISEIKVFEQ